MTRAADPAEEATASAVAGGPQLPRVLVPRPRLAVALQAGVPLIVLRAPLGFGKTTLVAQFLRDRRTAAGTAVAWLRISPDSAAPESFWPALLEALDSSVRLPAGAPEAGESDRARVRRALTRAQQPITLVLDDVDQLAPDGIEHELLMMVRDSPQLRLFVCLRGHDHFRPARYVDIDSVIITGDDLRFTVDETALLLRRCHVDRAEQRATIVHTETGGWPELTRACALALSPQRGASPPRTVRDDEAVATAVTADFLRDRLRPTIGGTDVLEFALAASVLDDVPDELATLLAGAPADQHGAYEWPPAARRVLYREARRRDEQRVLASHRVAATWYLDRDQPEHALRHATDARDWGLVAQIIEERWEHLVLSARSALTAAFAALPEDVIASSVLCRMVRTLALSTNDHALLDSLPRLPDDLAELDQLGRAADAPARLRLADAVMVTLRVHGRFAEASEQGERLTRLAEAAVVAQSAEVSDRLPGLLLQVGISHLHAAEFSLAHRALRRAYELAPHGRSTHIARDAAGRLALVLTAQGHTERAAQWLDRHDSAPRQDGWLGDQVDTTGLVVRAWAALDRLDLTAAARLLAAIQSDLIGGYALSAMIAYVEALYRLHTNRVEEALHELSRLITTNRALREPGSLPMVLTESLRADLLLALGRGNHARAALTAENLLHPLARVPLARLSLLSGDEAGAIAIANDFGSLHTAPPRLTVAMLVIKAIAHHRMRQPATATATLGNAISAARANHLRRPFATVARDELLEIAEGLRPDAREFLDHPALRAVESPYPAQLDLVHLTERERLILIRLATGERVHEVAAHLFLSYNTVRTYLRQIYKKLAANSREQAVAHARAYGLIPS